MCRSLLDAIYICNQKCSLRQTRVSCCSWETMRTNTQASRRRGRNCATISSLLAWPVKSRSSAPSKFSVRSLSCSHTGFRSKGPLGWLHSLCSRRAYDTYCAGLGMDVSLASWRASGKCLNQQSSAVISKSKARISCINVVGDCEK